MFVSLLTLFLILRRSGLKVKMFPRREKGRAVKPSDLPTDANRRALRLACGDGEWNSNGLSEAIHSGLICAHDTARNAIGLQGLRGQPEDASPNS